MHVTKRVFISILRKKGKSISLFLLVCVVAIFLISCYGVLNGSGRLREEIRTSLGAAFYIRGNTEVTMNENGEAQIKENQIHITQNEMDQITKTREIHYCNPINYGFIKSDAIQFIPGDRHTEENNMGKVTALQFSALAPDFIEETTVLKEGKHITATDHRKILISDRLAASNHIVVGDSLTLTHAKFGECDGAYIDEIPKKTAFVLVEVSGIYKCNIQENPMKPTAAIAENEIYASLDVLDELQESQTGIYTGEVDFYITDPAKLDQITRYVQQLESIDWSTHFIRTNDFQYSQIADQLASLGNLGKILLVLVSVVSTAVLTLLLTIHMRSRMREAGILLSVGITKWQIIAAFLLEVMMIAIAALILSYFISFGITDFLGFWSHKLSRWAW